MKATVSALATLLLAVAFAACGGGSSSGGTAESGAESTSTTSTTTSSTSTDETETEAAESPARARLIAEADAICLAHRPAQAKLQREVTADSEALNASETQAGREKFADDLRHAADVAETELEELRELPPPPGEGSRLRRIILAAQAGSVGALLTAEAVEAGDAKRVEEAVAQTRRANEGARELARGYGFQVCGQELE